MPDTQEKYLTYQEAAEYLGVTVRWLKDATADGVLPYYKFNRLVRFAATDLDDYADKQRRQREHV